MGKRICIYVAGLVITALGIALVIHSAIGAGPWDSVAVGLKSHLGLTIGIWTIITQGSLVFVTALIEKERPRFESILVVIIRSWFLDIWFYLVLGHVHFPDSQPLQWLIFTLGIILVGSGIGIYIEAKFPKSPIDDLMIVVSNRFGWSFNYARLLIECCGAALGFLLGGPVGLGTVFIAITLGKMIQVSNRHIKGLLKYLNKKLTVGL